MSEILLSAKDLKPVMLGLGKVVNRKSTLPVLEHVRIARENNVVILQATDLDEWSTYRYAEQRGDNLVFHVPFETLNKIVKAIKGDTTITLRHGKESRLVYEVGNSPVEVKLNGLGKDTWPAEPKVEGPNVPLPESFKSALQEALDCASRDSTRYVINGACLDVSGKDGHYVVGTDGRCLFASNTFEFAFKDSLIVPSGKFIEWNGFAEDGAWKLVTAKLKDVPYFRVASDRWTLTSKQIDGNYPNWRQCRPTPDTKWTRISFPQSEVEALLKNVPLLPGHDDINRPVTVQVTADAVFVKAKTSDAKEWTSLRLPVEKVVGKPIETTLNRDYLLKALRFGLLELAIDDALSPMVFGAPGKQLVVMPVRPTAPAPAPIPKTTATATQPPPAPSAESVTEERKTMPREEHTEPTAKKTALQQIDEIKEALKSIIRDLSAVGDALKQSEKERKASDREVEAVRTKLREIQSVKI